MRHRRLANFHSLKRGRIRQTWNKHNLFNLNNLRIKDPTFKTFFQQKWYAKAMTRAYHGEHIRERQWEHMFSRRLPSVVNMEPRYLATSDGSEFSSGRGSGRLQDPKTREAKTRAETTPYMHMIFGPMERRLDIAIFRALFASSARQARQMCVHGAVKVNGKKMVHPSYQLNPGDMFQVDVEKVMAATGRKKPTAAQQAAADRAARAEETQAAKAALAEAEAAKEDAARKAANNESRLTPEEATEKDRVAALNAIARQAKQIVRPQADKSVSVRRKQHIRALIRSVKGHLAKVKQTDPAEVDVQIRDVTELLAKLSTGGSESSSAGKNGEQEEAPESTNQQDEGVLDQLDEAQQKKVADYVEAVMENPRDDTKPYLTPWLPKPYMPAFAFIPRYLEVNQKICAAVYLRHPVARPGLAEVPTPFPGSVNELAFNWYLRRG